MKIILHRKPHGIAMVIVMVSIFVLAVLAGGFAYSMKVETKLAMNSNDAGDLECLGRSGIEVARWILSQQMKVPGAPYDALDQVWAGGPGDTNDPCAGFSLKGIQVGQGTISVSITDCERKANINQTLQNQDFLQHSLITIGVDAADVPTIIGAVQDWIDKDDDTHVNGAESDYYQGLNPPYRSKNGPIDDLSELLFIKGITPDIYSSNAAPSVLQTTRNTTRQGLLPTTSVSSVRLQDIFTPISNGRINVNTASRDVLLMIPGMSEQIVDPFISRRELKPYSSMNDAAGEIPREVAPSLNQYGTVRSSTFEVEVDAEIGQSHRKYYALLVRNNVTDIRILNMHWE